MPRLALTEGFLSDFSLLGSHERKQVTESIKAFGNFSVSELRAHKGLHLEKLQGARDPRIRTIRVSRSLRGVLLAPDDSSELFTLLRVRAHDEANSWAVSRAYSVNSATGALEVRNVTQLEHLETYYEDRAAQAPTRLFAAHSNTVLRDLGIDEQVLRLARICVEESDLAAMRPPLLPADQFEALEYLAAGHSADEVWEQLIVPRGQTVRSADSRETVTMSEAVSRTSDRIVEVTGPGELDRVLSGDFDRWRIFLHPTQHRHAYHPRYRGPAQVTGGPGTGKTVVALHRVRHLLRTGLPEDRLLLTTFTTAMASTLRDQLALLLGEADAHLLTRVEVTTVDAFAAKVLKATPGGTPRPLTEASERTAWTRALRDERGEWSERFLAQEYRNVVLAQDLRTAAEYLSCTRHGRGSQLGRVQRARLWKIMERFREETASRGTATFAHLAARAAAWLATHGPQYRHVVVDEAQDLHPAQWRVLRAAVAPAPDDIFLVGDPHQRIYDNRVSLRSVGVHVRGRSSGLRVNYRSTEEILSWSVRLLSDHAFNELGADDEADGGTDSLAGCRSVLRGPVPTQRSFASPREELAALVAQVRHWSERDGVPLAEIAVGARLNSTVDAVVARLRRDGLAAVGVRADPAPGSAGVRVSTMHGLKGLEFRCVALVGLTSSALPYLQQVSAADEDPAQHRHDLLAERCLLFVAATRARDALAVSWSGQPSSLLDPTVR
ncbi:UvrD-helicase domain-containing protein [Streptomyces spiramenti]|uniref:DNA 3'-5' helicase n=1 Tax=Streptomyces spiramenti TaxID=2720606 RepID=A0ABX1ALS4_9ACTN|nr:UvrD-helicase domain-containing protein [Streptomyces spiramenti]